MAAKPKQKDVTDNLEKLLADSYTLYLKTHNFHWNVTGPMFASLHKLFEEHYTELQTAVDDIAERIRALGEPAPGSYSEFAELTSVKEEKGGKKPIEAKKMADQLRKDHETVARTAKKVFDAASAIEDEPTADMAIQRMTVHEKTAWMLRNMAA